jgi:gluconokinase
LKKRLSLALALIAASALRLLVGKRPNIRHAPPSPYRALIVMGPSGCGKTTLSRALAAQTQSLFVEGDDHHPARNIARLTAGVPLTDEDRMPFLDSIGRTIVESARPTVVSCSALRRAHRDRLRSYTDDILFVWIDVPAEELARRLRQRQDHFMPPSLLADQLATFEPPAPPENYLRIDGSLPVSHQLEVILRHLGSRGSAGKPSDGISQPA